MPFEPFESVSLGRTSLAVTRLAFGGGSIGGLYQPDAVIERARRIGAVCDRYGVSRRAAAIQFPLAHPAVTGLIAGVRTPAHLDDYPASLRLSIPSQLWDELRASDLIAAGAPTPG